MFLVPHRVIFAGPVVKAFLKVGVVCENDPKKCFHKLVPFGVFWCRGRLHGGVLFGMLHCERVAIDRARGEGRPSTFIAQRLAVVLWSACLLAHCRGAPDSLGVQLLSPRPNTWPDFCVDQHGNVEVDVRLLVSGAQLIADQVTLKLLLDGKLHSLIAVAQDAAVRAAIRAQAPFGWPARVTLFLPDRQHRHQRPMTIEEFRRGHHQQRSIEVRLMVGDGHLLGDRVGDRVGDGVEMSTGEGEFFVNADEKRCTGDDVVSGHEIWDGSGKSFFTSECRSREGSLGIWANDGDNWLDYINSQFENTYVIFKTSPGQLPTFSIDEEQPEERQVTVPPYWKVVPHPCVDPAMIGARLRGDGHGFEEFFGRLLGHARYRWPGKHPPLVVDIGANVGAYTMTPASLGYRVISVEVNERRVRELKLMVSLNGWEDRVTVHHASAGDDNTIVHRCVANPFSSHVIRCSSAEKVAEKPHRNDEMLVPQQTATDLILEDVLLLKLDCDGCEAAFYQGLRTVLTIHKISFILAEVSNDDSDWAMSLIDDFGYVPYAGTGTYPHKGPFPGTNKHLDVPDLTKLAEALSVRDQTPESAGILQDRLISRENMLAIFDNQPIPNFSIDILFVHRHAVYRS